MQFKIFNLNKKILLTLTLCFVGFFLSTKWIELSGVILIILFGITHGANDIHLISFKLVKKNRLVLIRLNAIYSLGILLTFLVFILLPELGIFLFVVFSSYHFGEQYFEDYNLRKTKYTELLNFTYGFTIISLLLLINDVDIFRDYIFKNNGNYIKYQLLVAILSTIISGVLIYKKDKKNVIEHLLIVLFLALVFYYTSLLLGFVIYFVIWHSVPSMIFQMKTLYTKVTFSSIKSYFLLALPYVVITICITAVIYVFYPLDFYDNINSMFYYALFSVTIPHIIVMKMFLSSKNRQ